MGELLQPRMRGVLHEYALVPFIAAGTVLIVLASSAIGRVAMALYTAGIVICLAASTLYHRGRWRPGVKAALGRVDHAAIFLLIAGTYTPVCLLVLHGALAPALFIGVWVGAGIGVAMTFLWRSPPAWAEISPYIILGWVALLAIPEMLATVGWGAVAVAIAGGLLYTIGAVVYGAQRPNPRPRTFGYHEIFHACTIAAAATHCVLIYVWVLPRA